MNIRRLRVEQDLFLALYLIFIYNMLVHSNPAVFHSVMRSRLRLKNIPSTLALAVYTLPSVIHRGHTSHELSPTVHS